MTGVEEEGVCARGEPDQPEYCKPGDAGTL